MSRKYLNVNGLWEKYYDYYSVEKYVYHIILIYLLY